MTTRDPHALSGGVTFCLVEGPQPNSSSLARLTTPDQFLELSLRRFSTTTLTTYMRCLVSFLDFLSAGGRAIAELTLAELTDYLFAVQTGLDEDRSSNQTCPRTMLKALSWRQKVAQLEPLRPLLHNPVVMAFHSDSKPTTAGKPCPYLSRSSPPGRHMSATPRAAKASDGSLAVSCLPRTQASASGIYRESSPNH